MESKPRYKTWIKLGRLWLFLALAGVSLAALGFSLVSPWFLLFVIPLGIFSYIALIVGVSAYRFSPRGGDFQRRIHELVVSLLKQDGLECDKALDVGCGNASLTVKLARRCPRAKVYGIDYWGEDWDYSKQQCERNATLEGVGERVVFEKQSASALSFGDAEFDVVVSCLTFHEVNDVPDKLKAVREAVRVLRDGGQFVFLDLFADPQFFESPEKLRAALLESGADVESLKRLDEYMPLPFPLLNAKVLKYAMVVGGRKRMARAGLREAVSLSQ